MLGYFGGYYDTWKSKHLVTFDIANRLIKINPGVTTLQVKEHIYSAMKEWMLFKENDNKKRKPGVVALGGDPISETEKLGDTYFLEDGWKIKPWKGHSSINITGNIYTRDGSRPIIKDDSGIDAVSLTRSSLTTAIIVDTSTSIDTDAPVWQSVEGVANAYQNGSTINISWGRATDKNPVSYNIYVSKFNHNVFDVTNLLTSVEGYFYTLTGLDGEVFIPSTTYYIGVRAVDIYGNETTNTNFATVVFNDTAIVIDSSSIASAVWSATTRELTSSTTSSLTLEQHEQLMAIPTASTGDLDIILSNLQTAIYNMIGSPAPEANLVEKLNALDAGIKQVLAGIPADVWGETDRALTVSALTEEQHNKLMASATKADAIIASQL